MSYIESAIAATVEDSEALGFRFDPLSGDRCGSSGERRPRAFVRSDSRTPRAEVSLNRLLGRKDRPSLTPRRAARPVSEGPDKIQGRVVKTNPVSTESLPLGALGGCFVMLAGAQTGACRGGLVTGVRLGLTTTWKTSELLPGESI